MSAPRFHLFAHIVGPHRVRALRWHWAVRDGYVGPIVAQGRSWTERGAQWRAARAVRRIEQAPLLTMERRIAKASARLRRAGIPVEVRMDRGVVCVRPLCACSTADEVRVLAAFLAITSAVVWDSRPAEVAR